MSFPPIEHWSRLSEMMMLNWLDALEKGEPMQKQRLLVVSVISLAIFSGAAVADETKHKTVRAGVATLLAYHTSWNKECELTSLPDITTTQSPQHGSIALKDEIHPMHSVKIGTLNTCDGKLITARSVYYSANKGYAGEDRLSYRETLRTEDKSGVMRDLVVNYAYTIDIR
jgi:hypothetical protein